MRRVTIVSGSASGIGLLIWFMFSNNIEVLGTISGWLYNFMDITTPKTFIITVISTWFTYIIVKSFIQADRINKKKQENNNQ